MQQLADLKSAPGSTQHTWAFNCRCSLSASASCCLRLLTLCTTAASASCLAFSWLLAASSWASASASFLRLGSTTLDTLRWTEPRAMSPAAREKPKIQGSPFCVWVHRCCQQSCVPLRNTAADSSSASNRCSVRAVHTHRL